MQKNIMIVQSRTTGRFLLKCVDNLWTFPSVIDNDPEKTIVYMAMGDCSKALGQPDDDNNWMLEFIADNYNQIFHIWVDDEPMGKGELEWCHLFMMPENLDPIVGKVFSNQILLDKSTSPE